MQKVKVDRDFIVRKYSCKAAAYWREKLHVILNGLSSDLEPPSVAAGKRKSEQSVEDGWLLVDKDTPNDPAFSEFPEKKKQKQ